MGKEFVYQSVNLVDEEYLSFDIDEGKRRRGKREHLYEDEMSNEVVPFQLGMYGHQLTFDVIRRHGSRTFLNPVLTLS